MEINCAEDFGVGFNVLARQYRKTADKELLDLMNRTCGYYLPYFSIRTLSCAIRDLQMCDGLSEPTPQCDMADFDALQKKLLKYFISRKKAEHPTWSDEEILHDIAVVCQLTKDKFGEYARFEDDKDFFAYARDNGLLNKVEFVIAQGDKLPFNPDFQKDFMQICDYMKQYSAGRTTYMPSLTKSFVNANMDILSDAEAAI